MAYRKWQGIDWCWDRYGRGIQQEIDLEKRQRFRSTVKSIEEHFNGYGNEIRVQLEEGIFTLNGKSAFETMYMSGGKWSEGLEQGDVIEFDARIICRTRQTPFSRDGMDYIEFEDFADLEYPTKCAVIEKGGVDYEIKKMTENWHRGFV